MNGPILPKGLFHRGHEGQLDSVVKIEHFNKSFPEAVSRIAERPHSHAFIVGTA
ncbi:MAG: hypothetical protein AB7E77_08230 [Desulfobulbus sp.]